MKTLLGSICALSLYFTTVKAIKCTQCQQLSTDDCAEPPTDCRPDANRCVLVHLQIQSENVTVHNFVKTCGNESDCNNGGTARIGELRLSKNSSCCDLDSCTPATPFLPTVSDTLNGVRCPSCLSANTSSCDATTLECRGDETRCIKLTPRTKFPWIEQYFLRLTMHGCASETICSSKDPYGFLNIQCCNPEGNQNRTCTV